MVKQKEKEVPQFKNINEKVLLKYGEVNWGEGGRFRTFNNSSTKAREREEAGATDAGNICMGMEYFRYEGMSEEDSVIFSRLSVGGGRRG